MNISLILATAALYNTIPAQLAYTSEPLPYSSYLSLDLPAPSPLLEVELDSGTRPETSAPKAPSDCARHSYIFPTSTTHEVIHPFVSPAVKWGAGHRGVDIALDVGSDVVAAGDGVVIYAGKINDRSVISIEHADGIRTTYEPVSPSVARGDTVSAGQVIGTLDDGHCKNQSCLHWGAKRGKDAYINPLSLLSERRIRLIE